MLTSVDFFILNKAIHKICQDVANVIVKTHHKKIAELYKKWSVTVYEQRDCYNFSNYHLSDNEASLLKNGL